MAALVSPTGQDIILKGVHPNAGIEAAYKRKLRKMVAAMSKSVEYWLAAEYRAQIPEIAMDSPIDELNRKLKKLSESWQKKFDDGALNLASWFASAWCNIRNRCSRSYFVTWFIFLILGFCG